MKPIHMLVAALLPASAAFAKGGCSTQCVPDEYAIIMPQGICPPDPSGTHVECVSIEQAPGAWIHCTRSWSGYTCKGWPKGNKISHYWSVSPPLVLQSLPRHDDGVVKCGAMRGGGTVHLTVTSPVGLSSMTSVSLSCAQTIEQ